MRILELFAGSRSIGKAAEQLNIESCSTDIEGFEGINLVRDILHLKPEDIPFVPDVIWASPPCTTFSVASMWKHWKKVDGKYIPQTAKAIEGVRIVRRTLWLIREFQKLNPNLIWFIENPRGALRKMPMMQDLPIRHTVTYCQYGDFRMKPTDIWTNNRRWKPRPMCRPGADCHVSAPRGSHSGTQGMKDSFERSKIPHDLCIDVLKSVLEQ